MRGSRMLGAVAALAALTQGCGDRTPTPTGLGASPARLDILAGNDQSALAGTELPEPLVTRVTDGAGNPVSGQVLNFRVTAGGGSVFAGVAVSDDRGIAQERWTLGPTPGEAQTVEVRAVDAETGAPIVFATFRATAAAAPAPVATVTVEPSSATLEVGGEAQLTATLRDGEGNVLTGRAVGWSSSDPGVATVTGAGRVTAVSGGTATITATSEGRQGVASVTVAAPVASVQVTPSAVSLTVGGTRQLSATLLDRNGNVLTGRAVAWSSSNPLVASVSADGVVTARLVGNAVVTATSEGESGTASVAVTLVGGVLSRSPEPGG